MAPGRDKMGPVQEAGRDRCRRRAGTSAPHSVRAHCGFKRVFDRIRVRIRPY
jgi:hypothetical protein